MRMDESAFDYTGFYTIVLTKALRNQYEIVDNILRDCWTLYITNVIVVVALPVVHTTAIYTYFPYTQFHCGIVFPIILNYYLNDTFHHDMPLFPDKMKNFHRCPISVATFSTPPHIILIPSKNDNQPILDGIDGVTISIIAERLNFTVIRMIQPEIHVFPRMNRSSGGAINMVFYKYICKVRF